MCRPIRSNKKNELKINKYWSLINKKIKIQSEDDIAENLEDDTDQNGNRRSQGIGFREEPPEGSENGSASSPMLV